jgi:hypothetical protein
MELLLAACGQHSKELDHLKPCRKCRQPVLVFELCYVSLENHSWRLAFLNQNQCAPISFQFNTKTHHRNILINVVFWPEKS